MTTQTTLDRVARRIAEADGNIQPGCVCRKRAEAAIREVIAGVLADLTAECYRRRIPGADGEAILYLDAIFALADGPTRNDERPALHSRSVDRARHARRPPRPILADIAGWRATLRRCRARPRCLRLRRHHVRARRLRDATADHANCRLHALALPKTQTAVLDGIAWPEGI